MERRLATFRAEARELARAKSLAEEFSLQLQAAAPKFRARSGDDTFLFRCALSVRYIQPIIALEAQPWAGAHVRERSQVIPQTPPAVVSEHQESAVKGSSK
eukprot:m.320446 g.320446  ORF g.320446 m.320446 type:complete len:101 (+) comp15994_c0_seq8:176-478(+)